MTLQLGTIVKVAPAFKEVERRWCYPPHKLFEVMQVTPEGIDLLPEGGLVLVRVPAKYLLAWDDATEPIITVTTGD